MSFAEEIWKVADGALGSHLTGAGFGGCTVRLVEKRRLESFIRQVIREYYEEYLERNDRSFDSLIFPCRAAGGASVLAAGFEEP